jgi:hypothetical protein
MTTSSLADTVLEVTWVDGAGRVRVSKRGDPEFGAFNGGLGVFGIMTELLIQLTPPSNTQLISVVRKDANMMADINSLLKVRVMWVSVEGRGRAGCCNNTPAGSSRALLCCCPPTLMLTPPGTNTRFARAHRPTDCAPHPHPLAPR